MRGFKARVILGAAKPNPRTQQRSAINCRVLGSSPENDKVGKRRGLRPLFLLATLALAACATIEKPLQDTSLHVAFEQKSRREGFRRLAVVTEDYYYCSPLTRQVFRVPRGFETDFASIPYWASAVFNPIGDDAEPAVVHDWLYAVGEKGKRDEADAIFLNAMQTAHMPALQSKMMYEAVRAGGAANYGAPSEWRFVDPETEKPAKPPKKPASAVVTTLKRCDDLRGALPRLRLMSDLPHL